MNSYQISYVLVNYRITYYKIQLCHSHMTNQIQLFCHSPMTDPSTGPLPKRNCIRPLFIINLADHVARFSLIHTF